MLLVYSYMTKGYMQCDGEDNDEDEDDEEYIGYLNKSEHQIFSGTFLTFLVPLMRPVLLAAMRPTF